MNNRLPQTHRQGMPGPHNIVSGRESDFVNVADVVRLFSFLYRYAWLILIFSSIGIGGAYLYCQKAPRQYQSKTQMLVVQQRMETVNGLMVGTQGLEQDVATHVSVIQSPVFLSKIIANGRLNELASFSKVNDPVAALSEGIQVARDSEYERSPSNTLTIAFRGPDPDECPLILSAVNEGYLQFLDETSRSGKQDALTRITKKADDVLKELRWREAEYEEFIRNSSPEWGDIRQGAEFHRERLSDVRSRQLDLELQESGLKKRLSDFKSEVARIRAEHENLEDILELTPGYEPAENRAEFRHVMLPLLIEERQLLKKYGPGHHDVEEIHEKIKSTREYFVQGAMPGVEAPDSGEEAVRKYQGSMLAELKRLQTLHADLEKIAAKESSNVKRLTDLELQAKQYVNSISQSEKYYESLIAQIQGVQFTQGMKGVETKILLPPTVARQVSPNGPLAYAATTVLATLVGCCLAFILQITDKTFRDVGEVRRRLGLPVVGHITTTRQNLVPAVFRKSSKSACSPLVCAYHEPDSVHAEAFRGLRTALYFSANEDRRTIQVTSPNAGEGKSVLLANLAVSMAYSGKSVLIIDADMRCPNAHSLFGCENHIGLSSILLEEAEVSEAIQQTCVAGLSLMPSGAPPISPADLLTSSRFEELLGNLRLRFDYILVDSPPLLPITDARIISNRVDGVLMLLQFGKNSRTHAEKAKQILDDLEAFLFGVVVRSDKETEFGFYANTSANNAGNRQRDSKSRGAIALPRSKA